MARNFINFLVAKQVKTWHRNKLIKDIESGKLKVVPHTEPEVAEVEKKVTPQASTTVEKPEEKQPDTSGLESLEGLAVPKNVNQPFKVGQILNHTSPNHSGKVRFVIAFDPKTPVVQDLTTKKSFPTKLQYLS